MPTDYQALAAKTIERQIVLYEREVTKALADALVEIRSDMAAIYDKYAVDGVLTHADMTRTNRLVAIEKQIVGELDKATSANIATFKTIHPETYNASFFHQAWAIDQTASVRLDYGTLDIRAVRANLASKEFADALKNYSPTARGYIREAINNGLIRGQGYTAMMKDLRTAIGMTRSSALLIVRTEGQRAANAGTAAAYAAAEGEGVEGETVWVSTLDSETRDEHQSMDGRTRDADGLFHFPSGEQAPYPLHSSLSAKNVCNSRCTTRYEITGYEPALRRDRDAGLIPYQPYSSWRPPAAPR